MHIVETSWRGGPARLGGLLAEVVGAADEAGFDLISVADHVWVHPIIGGPLKNHLEAYTALSYIAAHTRRVRLLALATAASYRPPGLLAKMVTTLDVLSGGRAMLGIGSGDYPEEASGLGLPFPEQARDRFDLLEETVQACLAMWEGEHGSEQPFEGRRVRLERPLNLPQSLSRPHPPVRLRQLEEKVPMTVSCDVGFARFNQLLPSVLADRLQEAIAAAAAHLLGLYERLVDQA